MTHLHIKRHNDSKTTHKENETFSKHVLSFYYYYYLLIVKLISLLSSILKVVRPDRIHHIAHLFELLS